MKPKVDEYIKINSEFEWIEIQKYLFDLNYSWCDNTQNIIFYDNYPFPDYILIEINHKNRDNAFMFSYSHIPYGDSIIHEASKFLRKEKLKKINGKMV